MLSYSVVTQSLGSLTLLALALSVCLWGLLVTPGGRTLLRREATGAGRGILAYAWLISVTAMAGSLYLSEIAGLTPCLMCWLQRSAMYPLVLILGVAVWKGWTGVWRLALPVSLIGLGLSAYHVTIQFRPSLDVLTCSAAAPCTARYLKMFGFVSIPVMAGAAFLLIGALLVTVAISGPGTEAQASRRNSFGGANHSSSPSPGDRIPS